MNCWRSPSPLTCATLLRWSVNPRRRCCFLERRRVRDAHRFWTTPITNRWPICSDVELRTETHRRQAGQSDGKTDETRSALEIRREEDCVNRRKVNLYDLPVPVLVSPMDRRTDETRSGAYSTEKTTNKKLNCILSLDALRGKEYHRNDMVTPDDMRDSRSARSTQKEDRYNFPFPSEHIPTGLVRHQLVSKRISA